MPYLGTQPNDVKKNTGLYTPSEILQLEKDGHWGGSLELIEEQTVSSVSTVDFTSIKQNVYDVLFLQYNNFIPTVDGSSLRMRFYESGVVETSSVYQFAQQRGTTGGTFSDADRTTGASYMLITPYSMNGGAGSYNVYCYFYNLGNASKYSFITYHSFVEATSTGFGFGGGVLPQASTVDGIQIYTFNRTLTSGTMKLYGVKQ